MININNPDKLFWRIVFPLGAIFALAAQIISSACGLGLTFDSHLYLNGAEYFSGGLPGSMIDQEVFQSKPPLFPLFLSWIPLAILPFVYSVLMLLNLYVLARIISAIKLSRNFRNLSFLAIACFTPFILVHVYLWTEPLFLLLLYTSILILLKTIHTKLSNQSLAMLLIIGVLMVLIRHTGLFFLIGMFIAMSIMPNIGWRKATIVLAGGLLVFLFWNFGLMSDGMTGRLNSLSAPLTKGNWSRLQNIEYFLSAASTWILPNSIARWARLIVLVLFLGITIFYGWRQVKTSEIIKILIIISATYYFFMHINFLIYESSAERYLAPIFPLILIATFTLFDKLAPDKKKWLTYLILLWMIYPVTRTVKNTIFWQEKICNENREGLSENLKDYYHSNQD